MNSFQIVGLPYESFSNLFGWSDDKLAEVNAMRVVADAPVSYPCRVSLADAEPGERLLLLPYTHLGVQSPYRSSGPIFVREGAVQRVEAVGHVPPYVTRRLISARAYDDSGMMVEANVCEGFETVALIRQLFANQKVTYLHLHNAKPGCFSCRVNRA